jgi:hypothetical protein
MRNEGGINVQTDIFSSVRIVLAVFDWRGAMGNQICSEEWQEREAMGLGCGVYYVQHRVLGLAANGGGASILLREGFWILGVQNARPVEGGESWGGVDFRGALY